jgi:DNA-binding NtrC family response regulator
MAKRILVVDDEPSICHMLGHVLTDEHYQVETAGSVLDALAKLAATSFDLAIVDLFLPDTNGLNLAEAIRMLDPQTPVILITAYGTPSFESMASHPAISHYMHKPFSLERLLGLVHQIVPPPLGSKATGFDVTQH